MFVIKNQISSISILLRK